MNSRLPLTAEKQAAAWHAELDLEFSRAGTRTVMSKNRHCGPLRVQKALYPEGDEVCQAIILHPPSGIAGGDHLAISATLGPGSHAQLTTPGAGKWYRSGGTDASQTIKLTLAENSMLEWLPQESIIFSGARARMETRVELAAHSRFIGWDILCLGRAAAGERFDHGRFDLLYRIERDGRPIWLERGGFAGDDPMLHSPAGWAGATVCGTLLLSYPELPQQGSELIAACRQIAPNDHAVHGLSLLPGLLVARYLGDSSEAARLWFVRLWETLRPAYCARPALIPRIWNT